MPTVGLTNCSRITDYEHSLERVGLAWRLLMPEQDLDSALDGLSGLVLTGGGDVDPALYDETPDEKFSPAEPGRDAFEIALIRRATDARLPLLAICRGIQVLNVAAGGSLVQDIPTAFASDLNHSIDIPKDHVAHEIHVRPGSRLARALGAAADLETCPVNSRHHQSVARVAPSFVVSAASRDGVVEAIERPEGAFCVGVQWHPENFWRTGEFAGLFGAFVQAATRHRHCRLPIAD